MYTNYFGFNEKPFTLTPNPRFIYLSRHHNEAFAHLQYGINNHYGFIELTGEVGSGKTTVLRALLAQLGEDHYRSALIFNTCLTGVELLRSINHEYGLNADSPFANELLDELNAFLLKENALGITVVLVIDEAQNLSPEILEQLRLISNLETENDKLIQIVLAGQLELSTLLELPQLRQLKQRIAVRYRLGSMSANETRNYIRHRMVVAGETGGVSFSNAALRLIHIYSSGLPRLINNLCDRALLISYGDECRRVTAVVIFRAIMELRRQSIGKRLSVTFASMLALAIIILGFLSFVSGDKLQRTLQAPPASVATRLDVKPAPVIPATPPPRQTRVLKPERAVAAAKVSKAGSNQLPKNSKQEKKKVRQLDGGNDIRSLQKLLKQAGMYNGAVDGNYGKATAKAVSDFQMLTGISRDDTVGESTREALAHYYTNKKIRAITSDGNSK